MITDKVEFGLPGYQYVTIGGTNPKELSVNLLEWVLKTVPAYKDVWKDTRLDLILRYKVLPSLSEMVINRREVPNFITIPPTDKYELSYLIALDEIENKKTKEN